MPLEKVTQIAQTKPWHGELSPGGSEAITLYGQYTYGIAGERFFKEIRDNGKIMGTKCEICNLIYLPPRIYCERCFSELKEWQEIAGKGEIYAYTTVYVDLGGLAMQIPALMALVKFPGVYGGLVHHISEVGPDGVQIGMPVEVVLKQRGERVGSILDIKYFRPIR